MYSPYRTPVAEESLDALVNLVANAPKGRQPVRVAAFDGRGILEAPMKAIAAPGNTGHWSRALSQTVTT